MSANAAAALMSTARASATRYGILELSLDAKCLERNHDGCSLDRAHANESFARRPVALLERANYMAPAPFSRGHAEAPPFQGRHHGLGR